MSTGSRPVPRVCLLFAMEAEARAVTDGWNLSPIESAAGKEGAPFRYARTARFAGLDLDVIVALNGKDPRFACDNIGLEPAALNAWNCIRELRAEWIVSVGTCGAYGARDARVGDVFLSDGEFRFHDHDIPLAPFERYGEGRFASHDVRAIARHLGLRTAAVSSGTSLTYTAAHLARLRESGAVLKEMEVAAVAWVCSWFRIPCFAIKAVTNVIDVAPDTPTEFEKNFDTAVAALRREVPRVLERLGRS